MSTQAAVATEKPLHVRVGEALGWTDVAPCGDIMATWASGWDGCPPGTVHIIGMGKARWKIPRFDDELGGGWSATGPLIEKYGIGLYPEPYGGWTARRNFIDGAYMILREDRPLAAVCGLIIQLARAGTL